jgi:hypothetical protein
MTHEIRVYGQWWACNREGEGLFKLDAQGSWHQLRGTNQTPCFKSEQQLRRYIYRHYRSLT